jgi:hypothetical protein
MLSDDIHVIEEFIKARADTDFYNAPLQRIKEFVELAQQTTNSDYAAALFETIVKSSPSYIDTDGETVVSLTKGRLNAALKAARHCA